MNEKKCPKCGRQISVTPQDNGILAICPSCEEACVVPSSQSSVPVPPNVPCSRERAGQWKKEWDAYPWFMKAVIGFWCLLFATTLILLTGVWIKSLCSSHGKLSLEEILGFFILGFFLWGLVGSLPMVCRIRNRDLALGPHDRCNVRLKVGDRSSVIIEDRISAWITLYWTTFHALGVVLGLAIYPYVVAYSYEQRVNTLRLLVASGVCVIGSTLNSIISTARKQSSGCLSFLFTCVVIGISLTVSGIRPPPGSEAWFFIFFPCIIFGAYAAAVISIPLGVICAIAPVITGRPLLTAKGKPYGTVPAIFLAIAFTLAAPLLAIWTTLAALTSRYIVWLPNRNAPSPHSSQKKDAFGRKNC